MNKLTNKTLKPTDDYSAFMKRRGYVQVQAERTHSMFVKKHMYNTCYCVVLKDAHCKGKSIHFTLVKHRNDQNAFDAIACEHDSKYLKKECQMIERFFEETR